MFTYGPSVATIGGWHVLTWCYWIAQSTAENWQSSQEVWEQHHLLQRDARPVESRRVRVKDFTIWILQSIVSTIQLFLFTIINNTNSLPFKLLSGCSRTYHPASLLLSQRKVNMKFQKICKVKSILNLLTRATFCDGNFQGPIIWTSDLQPRMTQTGL